MKISYFSLQRSPGSRHQGHGKQGKKNRHWKAGFEQHQGCCGQEQLDGHLYLDGQERLEGLFWKAGKGETSSWSICRIQAAAAETDLLYGIKTYCQQSMHQWLAKNTEYSFSILSRPASCFEEYQDVGFRALSSPRVHCASTRGISIL